MLPGREDARISASKRATKPQISGTKVGCTVSAIRELKLVACGLRMARTVQPISGTRVVGNLERRRCCARTPLWQRLLRQYLHLCTSKASKRSTCPLRSTDPIIPLKAVGMWRRGGGAVAAHRHRAHVPRRLAALAVAGDNNRVQGLQQLLRCQNLYFCTSKARKLSTSTFKATTSKTSNASCSSTPTPSRAACASPRSSGHGPNSPRWPRNVM